MLTTLIQKELRSILLSPKFPATFAICSLLIIMSVLIGVREFNASVRQYETGRNLTEQQMREQSSWGGIRNRAFRTPDPMQIFVSGVSFDLGRWAMVDRDNASRLRNSVYSEDPIFAVFRFMDLSFIFLVVLSLLAIVFTYDAVCGERESGTLRLVFSNSISRANYLIAKMTGAWLGLLVPLAVPVLISLLIIQVFAIPFTGTDWFRLICFLGVSLLFLTFFVVFGVLMSTLTRRPSISFLLSLMGWVMFIFILPRIGVLVASQIVPVPSVAEIEGQRETLAKNEWQKYYAGMEERLSGNMHKGDHTDTTSDSEMWKRIAQEDSIRKSTDRTIEEFEAKLMANQRQAQRVQERLAFTLCRISPASAFQLAGMTLANTDIDLKQRYEEAMNVFRTTFNDWVEKKSANSPQSGRFTISIDSKSGFNISTPRGKEELDLTDMPTFSPPVWSLGAALSRIIIDSGLLLCLILAAFAGSWVAFMRYDLR
jgi:ABC-type transport system involved in multi-copper enzyme maturation permease subunit